MAFMKGLLYATNLVVQALAIALSQLSPTPNDTYNNSYYNKATYQNLAAAIPWITQSLQTMNTNSANEINQSTDYVAGLIGTPPTTSTPTGRRLEDSGNSYPKDTLHHRFEYIEDFLAVMSNDINDIGEAVGIKTGETNGGKTAKKAKTKKNNLFAESKAEDEENDGPGRDRLLQVSLTKQIEDKIDSKIGHLESKIDSKIGHLESKIDSKIGHLESNIDKKIDSKIGHLETKIDNLEDKMDKLENLILSLLDTTQKKLE